MQAVWKNAWDRFAGVEDEEPVRQRIRELRQLRDYAVHGVDDRAVGPCLSVVDGEGKRRDLYAHDFAPDTDPAPREWEWGVQDILSSLADARIQEIERARARGEPLDVPAARQAYAMRRIAQMIVWHVRLLVERRGGQPDPYHMMLWPDEIQWAALGFVAGCEESAAQLARVLCAAWRLPGIYCEALVRPEVGAIFTLFARHLDLSIPDLAPFKPLPALEALIAVESWLAQDPATLAPLFEAACAEHAVEAPIGPFQGLPIAIVLLCKLRALRGLANPQIRLPLLRCPLGDWAPPVDFAACLDPILSAVYARLKCHGFDEVAIAAAVIDGAVLEAPGRFARPAIGRQVGAEPGSGAKACRAH